VFLDGEHEFAALLVERFTCYHRRSYVCKSGVGDVLIGAAAAVADYNGVEKASHVRDKLVEMTHLNETVYATGIVFSSTFPQIGGVYTAIFNPEGFSTDVAGTLIGGNVVFTDSRLAELIRTNAQTSSSTTLLHS